MHILLTRPLEDCSEMILKFQSLGHQVSHLPLINIEKVNYDKLNLSEFGGIIFTSANAVKFFNIEKLDKDNAQDALQQAPAPKTTNDPNSTI